MLTRRREKNRFKIPNRFLIHQKLRLQSLILTTKVFFYRYDFHLLKSLFLKFL